MTRMWPHGQPIPMQTDDEGRPVLFVLNEQRFRLLRIEQH